MNNKHLPNNNDEQISSILYICTEQYNHHLQLKLHDNNDKSCPLNHRDDGAEKPNNKIILVNIIHHTNIKKHTFSKLLLCC